MARNGKNFSQNEAARDTDLHPPSSASRRVDANTTAEPINVQPEADTTSLSVADQRHLEEFEKKLQLVRDRTGGVARSYDTGFFLHGPSGVSKSYTVLQELERLQVNHHVSNSRVTGRGLFDILDTYPDCVHVIEDVEQMMNDRNALGVLRSALWGQQRDGGKGRQERWVTWSAHKAHKELLFTGGVIVISNRELLDLPELEALKTRIFCMRLQPSDNELRALMRHVASRGFEHEGLRMDATECREVCEFVIAESLSLHRPLDMRLLVSSFCHWLQWDDGHAGCHWQDTVAARVRERPVSFKNEVTLGTRASGKASDLEVAREIQQATADRGERLRLWQERTGKSEPSLYRRLKELSGG